MKVSPPFRMWDNKKKTLLEIIKKCLFYQKNNTVPFEAFGDNLTMICERKRDKLYYYV